MSLCDVVSRLFPGKATGDMWQQQALLKRQERTDDFYPSHKTVLNELFSGADPYSGLQRRDMSWTENWRSSAGGHTKELRELIESHLDAPVRFVVEVGSFIGTAAVRTWGPLALHSREPAVVLCVDTWLGDLNMRLLQQKQFARFMRLEHGVPQLHRVFLDRVVSHNLTGIVLPLAMPSLSAARLLKIVRWRIDVVFVDSAHELGETLVELFMYWRLLRPGGLLIGDDYRFFPAVRRDVRQFTNCSGVKPQFMGKQKNIWYMQKPSASPRSDSRL